VNRATARASEVGDDELRSGADRLRTLVRDLRPGAVAVLGKGAYQTGFRARAAAIGPQEASLEGVPLWILPNPSGLNAHYTVDRLAEAYAQLRQAIA
jgi:TDG/mug DNA glycosylase family protein